MAKFIRIAPAQRVPRDAITLPGVGLLFGSPCLIAGGKMSDSRSPGWPRWLSIFCVLLWGGCATAPIVSVLPEPRIQVQPAYPAEMRRAGTTGKVVVSFIVDTEGNAQSLTVTKSTNKEFAVAALAAVSKWRFKPGSINGRPVNCRMEVPVVFEFTGAPASPTATPD